MSRYKTHPDGTFKSKRGVDATVDDIVKVLNHFGAIVYGAEYCSGPTLHSHDALISFSMPGHRRMLDVKASRPLNEIIGLCEYLTRSRLKVIDGGASFTRRSRADLKLVG